jgi:hypothetical protein
MMASYRDNYRAFRSSAPSTAPGHNVALNQNICSVTAVA